MGIPGQYFIFVSFVFSYFYISSLEGILQWDRTQSKSLLFWSLVLLFITYRTIDTLQSVRTYTGAWVLFYGVYRYHLTKKIKYLWLMLCAPLIHVAYFIIALPAFGYIVVKRLPAKLVILLYFSSFLLSVNPTAIVRQLQSTELGARKVDSYYKEDPSQYREVPEERGQSFYKEYGRGWALKNAPHFVVVAIILFGLFSPKRMTSLETSMFTTGILLATMANIGGFIPVFYNRTMVNAGLYILAALVMLLIRGELLNAKGYTLVFRKGSLWFVFLAFVPYLFFVASNVLQFTSIFMLAGAPAGFFEEFNMSIREFLGLVID
jgi:hypothetical protein